MQLLQMKIPKAQKDSQSHQCLFALLVSVRAKDDLKKLMKLSPGEI